MFGDPKLELLAVIVIPLLAGCSWLLWADVFLPAPRRRFQFRITTGRKVNCFSIADAFDPAHSMLWESQISALRHFSDRVSLEKLDVVFDGLVDAFPELYEGSLLEDWLDFLCRGGLIEIDDDHAIFTPDGKAFFHSLEARVESISWDSVR